MSIFCCLCLPLVILGNYYGTPKPSAEPSPVQPDLVDQVLFDEEFDTEVQRKRTTSVSKMDRKDSAAPEEEEEEERPPMVNGLAGERQYCLLFFIAFTASCNSAVLHTAFLHNPSVFFLSNNSLYFSQNAKQRALFVSSLSFFSPNIPRISCSACKVSTKSQPCKVEQ